MEEIRFEEIQKLQEQRELEITKLLQKYEEAGFFGKKKIMLKLTLEDIIEDVKELIE